MIRRRRGQVGITINGSYWVGAALAALAAVVLLDPRVLPVQRPTGTKAFRRNQPT